MSENKINALLLLVAAAVFAFTLAYVVAPDTLPAPTIEIERVSLSVPAPAPSKVEPLPSLLELIPVPEITYSLPGDSNPASFLTCTEFEVLPTADRTVFVLDAMDGSGLDRLNPCVRDHAAKAGDLVVTQCRGGDSLDKAFGRAIGYFQLECSPGVPQWDLEPAESHREFLGEIF